MRLTIMCGLPNSGKTTLAGRLAEEQGAVLIKLDDYRHLGREGLTPWQIQEHALDEVREALEKGSDVIYDTTNSNPDTRAHVLEKCAVNGCEKVCVYMDTPEEQCLERDESGWTKQYIGIIEPPTLDEGFDRIIISDAGVSA